MSVAFDQAVAQRLPLAESMFRLLNHALDRQTMQGVFASHRGRSYEDAISFPLCVDLLAEALLKSHGSAHRAFQRAIDDGRLDATVQAMYGKLRRLPIAVSLAAFDAATARLREVTAEQPPLGQALPESLQSFRALCFDGKKLKYVVRKLKPLRGLKGQVFGGKLLVVQDMVSRQAVALEADEDGEAADNPLVPGAVERVRAISARQPRLWVADRAFSEYTTLPRLTEQGDHFVVRFNRSCKLQEDPATPARAGRDRDGRKFVERWGWLDRKNPLRVRLMEVERPGKDPLILVTNLLDADRYPADDLLELYRRRWGIEAMLQQVVQTFDLRHLIGGTPQASIFQAVMCLLLYNITLMVRDIVAAEAQQEPEEVSLRLLFDDIVCDVGGWLRILDVAPTLALLDVTPIKSSKQLHACLRTILKKAWTHRWRKAPTRRGVVKRPPRAYLCGGHSSVAKIRRGQHQEIPLDQPSALKVPPQETKKVV